MPNTTHVDDRGFIRLTVSGSWPTLDELRRLRKDLDTRGGIRCVLADIRAVTEEFPFHSEIRSAIEQVQGSQFSATRRRAVLVGTDVQFGIARMFQSLLPGQVEIFRDESAAITWLLEAAPKA